MSADRSLNGCDYLMLGFDHELRKRGFAGNSCHIVLELDSAISPEALQGRLRRLSESYPILGARPGGLIFPKWELPRRALHPPAVRIHGDEPARLEQIINEPLNARRGQLMRFDLIEAANGRMKLVFSWAHALMDAPAAEHFLALVGNEELPMPAGSPAMQEPSGLSFARRAKMAWKPLHQLDRYCEAAPRSLGDRCPGASPLLRYRLERFSADETARIRANASRHCGIFGDGQYHASVAVTELHRLHQRLNCPSASYCVPVAVGLRRKGAIEPLFSNQVSMLMTQFLPAHAGSVADAVARLKAQTNQAMRDGLVESGIMLSDMFRFLPVPIYMALLKQGLRGEICSLFYGDTASVSPLLTRFLGATIEDLTHVAAVTPSPGIGVVFYHFRGALRLTVLHLSTVLTEDEAAEFAAGLRARLLEP